MVNGSNENRYTYKCSLEELLKRKLTLRIYCIIKDSDKKWITKKKITELGIKKYGRDWPRDPDTVFRCLKTMSKYDLVTEKSGVKGQSTLWSNGKKQIPSSKLMIDEIEHLKHLVSDLPKWVFQSLDVEINSIQDKIRDIFVDLEDLKLKTYWILLGVKEKELFNHHFSLLDKQLGVIFLFYVLNIDPIDPKLEKLKKWYDLSEIPYKVKADFELLDIFQRNFYPSKTRDEIWKKLSNHELDEDFSKILRFILQLRSYIIRMGYDYAYAPPRLSTEDYLPYLGDEELLKKYKESYSREEMKILDKRGQKAINSKIQNIKMERMLSNIDTFIANYKRLLE